MFVYNIGCKPHSVTHTASFCAYRSRNATERFYIR